MSSLSPLPLAALWLHSVPPRGAAPLPDVEVMKNAVRVAPPAPAARPPLSSLLALTSHILPFYLSPPSSQGG